MSGEARRGELWGKWLQFRRAARSGDAELELGKKLSGHPGLYHLKEKPEPREGKSETQTEGEIGAAFPAVSRQRRSKDGPPSSLQGLDRSVSAAQSLEPHSLGCVMPGGWLRCGEGASQTLFAGLPGSEQGWADERLKSLR